MNHTNNSCPKSMIAIFPSWSMPYAAPNKLTPIMPYSKPVIKNGKYSPLIDNRLCIDDPIQNRAISMVMIKGINQKKVRLISIWKKDMNKIKGSVTLTTNFLMSLIVSGAKKAFTLIHFPIMSNKMMGVNRLKISRIVSIGIKLYIILKNFDVVEFSC